MKSELYLPYHHVLSKFNNTVVLILVEGRCNCSVKFSSNLQTR